MNTSVPHGEPKVRILTTASRLFYEQGYHATGINQLIAEAGVAKASFYQHFRSKEDLCVAYLQQCHRDWFTRLRQEVESHTQPQEKLLSLFTFIEKWIPIGDFRGCAFQINVAEFPAPDSRIRQEVVAHKTVLRDYIKSLVKSLASEVDQPNPPNTSALADTIYILFEGAIVESQIYRTIWPIKAAREAVEQMIAQR